MRPSARLDEGQGIKLLDPARENFAYVSMDWFVLEQHPKTKNKVGPMNKASVLRTPLAIIGFLLMGLLAVTGFAQQPSPPSPPTGATAAPAKTASSSPEKVVIKVGDEQVTEADLQFLMGTLNPQAQQSVATQGRRSVGDQYALMILLSQEALRDHLDSSPRFRQQMALQRVQLLAQAEYQNLTSQVKVNPEEISQYYSTHQAELEQAQVRRFIIRKRPEGAKEGTPGLGPQEARARADSIRKAFAAGRSVKDVAQDFKGSSDVFIDTESQTIRRGQLPRDMDKAAFQLKDGELSDPMDTPQALVFLQVVRRRRPELKEVSGKIDSTLRQQKVETALTNLKKKTTIWMDEEYFKAPAASPPAPSQQPPANNRAPQP